MNFKNLEQSFERYCKWCYYTRHSASRAKQSIRRNLSFTNRVRPTNKIKESKKNIYGRVEDLYESGEKVLNTFERGIFPVKN